VPARERHASWLELFFDLAFVVAIAELAQELVRDQSLGGFGAFAGLFLPVFIARQGFTFYADRFDTDDVLFRAVMLAGVLAIAALAVQIPDVATGRRSAAATGVTFPTEGLPGGHRDGREQQADVRHLRYLRHQDGEVAPGRPATIGARSVV